MSTYTQCHLRRGQVHTVSWIPTKVAARGNILRLKDETGGQDGWEVLDVWGTKPASWVIDGGRDHKKHRKATDI